MSLPLVRGQLCVIEEEDVLLEGEARLPENDLHAAAPGVQTVVLAQFNLGMVEKWNISIYYRRKPCYRCLLTY